MDDERTALDTHRVMLRLLESYLSDPWKWPREPDLMVDVVCMLRKEFPAREVSVRFPRNADAFAVSSEQGKIVPRVRTEVKVSSESEIQKDLAWRNRTKAEKDDSGSRRRVDVAVLRARNVQAILAPGGVRDVLLPVRAVDVAVALELKLYPDLYVRNGHLDWMSDLHKLSRMSMDITRGLLFIDTSLPIATVGITYRDVKGSPTPARIKRRRKVFSHWPLPAADFSAPGHGCEHQFKLVDEPREGRLYLWALALRADSEYSVANKLAGNLPFFPPEEFKATCWEISRDTEDGPSTSR